MYLPVEPGRKIEDALYIMSCRTNWLRLARKECFAEMLPCSVFLPLAGKYNYIWKSETHARRWSHFNEQKKHFIGCRKNRSSVVTRKETKSCRTWFRSSVRRRWPVGCPAGGPELAWRRPLCTPPWWKGWPGRTRIRAGRRSSGWHSLLEWRPAYNVTALKQTPLRHTRHYVNDDISSRKQWWLIANRLKSLGSKCFLWLK